MSDMLLTMVDVVGCGNPRCRDFGKVVPVAPGLRSYYCPVCGHVSNVKNVDAALAADTERYRAYLREEVSAKR